MIDTTTHAMTEFALEPTYDYPPDITAGPDGNLWFIDQAADAIGMINPTTHVIKDFTLPIGSFPPQAITAGPDGNLWFTDETAAQVGQINPTTDAITEFAVPTANSVPFFITAGPDGNLWFTESNADNLGMINPTTHAITEYPVPYSGSAPYGIAAGPDGNIWFADDGTRSIGVETLNSTHLVVTQQPPASVSAGTAFGLTVVAEDSSGNLDSSFNGTLTVTLASNLGGATLGGTLTATASGGIATFSGLTLNKAAPGYTLNLSGSGVASATTRAITVTPAPASQLVITQQPPASVIVGSGFGVQATIEDPYGNVETDDSAAVAVALANNPDGATVGGTLSATAINGVANFSGLTLDHLGSGYTLAVSSSGLKSATSNAIAVVPVLAQKLVISQSPPASVIAGSSFGLIVQAEDDSGDFASAFNGTVTVALASGPGGTTLGGTLSGTASDGVATFSGLTLTKAASGYTILVSSDGLSGATSSSITATPAPASQLVITQPPPSSVTAGSGFGLQATIEDAYDNVETSESGSVSVALANNPIGATLGGTLSVAASNGVAAFSELTLTKAAAGYTLQVSVARSVPPLAPSP